MADIVRTCIRYVSDISPGIFQGYVRVSRSNCFIKNYKARLYLYSLKGKLIYEFDNRTHEHKSAINVPASQKGTTTT